MTKRNKYLVSIFSIFLVTVMWFAGKPREIRNDLWRFKMFAECGFSLENYIDKEMHLGISTIGSLVAKNDTVYRLETANTAHYLEYKFHLYPVTLVEVLPEDCHNKSPLLVNTEDLDEYAALFAMYENQISVDVGHVLFSTVPLVKLEVSTPSLLKSIAVFVGVNLLLIGLGYLILLDAGIGSFLKLLLSPLLGYAILNLVSTVLLLLTKQLAPVLTIAVLFIGFAVLLALNRLAVISELDKAKKAFVGLARTMKASRFEGISAAMIVFTLMSVGICLLHILFRPVWAGDAVAFWMMKANIIFNEGLDFRSGLQNEYPIFWSQLFSIFYGLNGAISQAMAKWYVLIELLLIYGFIWEFTKGLNARTRIFFMFIYFPAFGYHWSYSLFAETIVVLFSFGFARVTMAYFQDEIKLRDYLIAASLLTIGVAYSKLEGIFQIAMILAPFILVYGRIRSLVSVYFAGLAVAIIASLMLWKGFIVDSGWNVSAHATEVPNVAKVLLIVDKLFNTLGNMSFFTLAIAGGFIQFILAKRPSRLAQSLLIGVVLIWFFSGFSLLGWDTDRIAKDAWTAMPRLIWHATPLILFLSIQLLKDFREKELNVG